MNKRRVAGTVFAILALFSLLFIFANSLQNGSRSNSLSDPIIEKAADAVEAGGSSDAELVRYFKNFIRKTAHMFEFCIFGTMCYLAAYCLSGRHDILVLSTSFAGLTAAVIDEYIQYHTPGRTGMVPDILVDFAGVTSGILISRLAVYIYQRRKKGRG